MARFSYSTLGQLERRMTMMSANEADSKQGGFGYCCCARGLASDSTRLRSVAFGHRRHIALVGAKGSREIVGVAEAR